MLHKTLDGRHGVKVKSGVSSSPIAPSTGGSRPCSGRPSRSAARTKATSYPLKAGRCTANEVADEYREARLGQVSVRSWASDKSALRVHIVPTFGRLPVDSITPVQIEKVFSALAARRSVRTGAPVRTTLRGVFA